MTDFTASKILIACGEIHGGCEVATLSVHKSLIFPISSTACNEFFAKNFSLEREYPHRWKNAPDIDQIRKQPGDELWIQVDKHKVVTLPNIGGKIYPLIHSPNNSRLINK